MQKNNDNQFLFEALRIDTIDGFRGLATLFVCYYHFLTFYPNTQHAGYANFGSLPLINMFFVASGFLISASTTILSQKTTDWKKKFYLLRAVRILPVWWLTLIGYSLIEDVSINVLLLNASMLFGFFMYDRQYNPVTPAWSIFVEEAFYLFFPFLFSYVKQLKHYIIIFFVTFFISVLWLKAAPLLGVPTSEFFIERFPLNNLHYFLIGIIIFHIYKHVKANQIVVPWKHSLDFFVLLIWLSDFYNFHIMTEVKVSLMGFLLLFSNGFFNQFMRWSVLRWVGVRCYFVYITHTVYIAWLGKHSAMNGLHKFFMVLAFILTGAAISWKFFEEPLIKFVKKIKV